jgi:phosphatidylcholine synthase
MPSNLERNPLATALSWGVHLYTSLGLVCALLALIAAGEHRARDMFVYLVIAFAIDSSDGTLARRVNVWKWTPSFDGRKLDDITDYLNYTFIPVYFIYVFGLVPAAWSIPVLGTVLVASAYGFCSDAAKTDDGYFTGFPSYWNVVAFYLSLLGLSPEAGAIILLIFAALVFVPIKYLYPSKTPVFKKVNIGFGIVWALMGAWIAWDFDHPNSTVVWLSLLYPAYYMLMSVYLHFRPVSRPASHA